MRKNHKYTREFLEPLVKESSAWAEVCRKIGLAPMTGSQAHLARRAKQFGIDCSHFKGRAWNKGRTFPKLRRSLSDYLKKDSHIKSHLLKTKLIEAGLKKKVCEICNSTEWLGEPIDLELDHKNSDHWDNRLENLQIICPNCHARVTRHRRAVVEQLADSVHLECTVRKDMRVRISPTAPFTGPVAQ